MTPKGQQSVDSTGPSAPQTVLHRRWLKGERRPEPARIEALVARMEEDYQFKLAWLVLASWIQTARVTIEVAPSSNADASESADRAEILSDRLLSLFQRSQLAALRAIAYGRAAFEKTYRYDPASGLLLPDGLDYLPFEMTRMVLDEEGSYAGIELRTAGTKRRLEPSRSWWFALDASALEPHGRSRFLGAAEAVYKQRQELARQEEIWYSKFAIGHGVARAPERRDDPNALPLAHDDDPLDVMKERCSEIESGGILVLSSRTYPEGKYLYDYQESEGQRDGAPLENRRRSLDAAALRALGIPEKSVTQDDSTGSYALAEAHAVVLGKTCDGILAQLVESYQRYVIEKAVELNWPADDRPSLKLVAQPVGDPSHARWARLAEATLQGDSLSPLVREGVVDVPRLLQLAKVPLSHDASARLDALRSTDLAS